MATQVATSFYNRLADEFETKHQFTQDTAATDRLTQLRNNAFSIFKAKGFPSIKEEDWRFTNLVPFLDSSFDVHPASVDTDSLQQAINEEKIPGLDTYQLVLVNGSIRMDLSHLPAEDLMTVQPLRNIINESFFIDHISNNSHVGVNALVALNTAFFSDGYFVEVKKNSVVDKPLLILHLYTSDKDAFFQPRHFVVVNRNAKAEIIERSAGIKDETVTLTNSVLELLIQENAHLVHHTIQSHTNNERWLNYNHVDQQRSSRYDNFTCTLPGADLVRNNLEISLNGTATETHLYGLYLVADHQLTDNHTAIQHLHPSCQSNELYKGVIMDTGKAVFNGKVFVAQDAQQTNAYQQNNNLLLSDKAQVYAKPQLEIFADDVKCSHGCTIGQFNPESLFYLRSRGISETAARKLLVEAFAFDVTEKIDNEAVKQYVQQLIYSKLSSTSVRA